MNERTWIRWGGAHATHAVYEMTSRGLARVVCDTCKAVLPTGPDDRRFAQPISVLLAMPDRPTCDARVASGEHHDDCLRRVKRTGDRCWQHR